MSVVTPAAAFTPEPAALVQGKGGRVGGSNLEAEVVGALFGGPGEKFAQQSLPQAATARIGPDGHGVELGWILDPVCI
jgi:hypothetical protein